MPTGGGGSSCCCFCQHTHDKKISCAPWLVNPPHLEIAKSPWLSGRLAHPDNRQYINATGSFARKLAGGLGNGG